MTRLNNWFEIVKDIIKDFSSLEFQTQAFKGQNNLWTDPDEMISLALDDFCIDEWFEEYSEKLTPHLRKEMKFFISQIQELPRYDDTHTSIDSILSTPEWKGIRILATSILEQLQEIPDPALTTYQQPIDN